MEAQRNSTDDALFQKGKINHLLTQLIILIAYNVTSCSNFISAMKNKIELNGKLNFVVYLSGIRQTFNQIKMNYFIENFINRCAQHIAVGVRMFLRMQDFYFA